MHATTLSADQIRDAVSPQDAIAAVREGFISLARGEFEMPTRTVLRDGQFLVMSAHHRPSATSMIKTLSLNFEGRNPAIVGTVTWSDLQRTGHLVSDAGTITALRTGAASGVATDLLAAPKASNLTVIGAGGQAAGQVRAVHAVRPLTRLCIVDRAPERLDALSAQMRSELPDVIVSTTLSVAEAVADADIICCATTSTEPLFRLHWLKPDVHVNAIGAFRPSMRELPDELLADAAVVYIDETEAILEESGEVIHALRSGAITPSQLREIGSVLESGDQSLRTGRTVFKTVGVAMQDWAIAKLLADRFADQY